MNEYIRNYKPLKWLFPGAKPEKHITTRTVQAIFEQACEKAKIGKEDLSQIKSPLDRLFENKKGGGVKR